uniref:Uncharacterized protein n=1 Tax=Caulerpa verticillata TaxID=177082 RepID=A0A386B093_9CHLO|nr:hypothetical protein [Caulerpa verticillata]AYC65111.1 hypothetical protein [Caulerpa verticillata]
MTEEDKKGFAGRNQLASSASFDASSTQLFTYSDKYIHSFIWDLLLLLKLIHPGFRWAKPGKPNSLADWAKRLDDITLSKIDQKNFSKNLVFNVNLINYMKNDVKILVYIWAQLVVENYTWVNTHTQKKTCFYYIYKKLFFKLIFGLPRGNPSYLRGVNIDIVKVQSILKEKKAEQRTYIMAYY